MTKIFSIKTNNFIISTILYHDDTGAVWRKHSMNFSINSKILEYYLNIHDHSNSVHVISTQGYLAIIILANITFKTKSENLINGKSA